MHSLSWLKETMCNLFGVHFFFLTKGCFSTSSYFIKRREKKSNEVKIPLVFLKQLEIIDEHLQPVSNALGELCFEMSCCDPGDPNRRSGFGSMPDRNLSQTE